MNTDALSIANYFIDLANRDGEELRQWGLMKRVYITYGFCLALYDRTVIDTESESVEAWDNGPVIPSVYYYFKDNRGNPIRKKAVVYERRDGRWECTTPELADQQVKAVADMVWERYRGMTDTEIVSLLHRDGTPWSLCYRQGANNPIPDIYTKTYYAKLIRNSAS